MRTWLMSVVIVLILAPLSTAQIFFSTQFTANQEVPPVAVATEGSGTGFFVLNDDMTELRYTITVCDLTGPITAAHFHNDGPGSAGPVVKTITSDFTGNTAAGVWTSTDAEPLSAEMVSALFEGEIYVNIHTAANAPGEIRGQLGGLGFTAKLDTTQEVPSPEVESKGSGTASMTLNPSMTALKFDVTVDSLTGPIVAAHFHQGAEGEAGPVVKTISGDFDGNTASGFWRNTDNEPLTPELVDELLAGNLYLNVHTQANQPGEIRGQVLLDTDIHFTSQLTVGQEVPPVGVSSEGSGTAAISLDDSRDELTYDVTVTNLTGPIIAAHFHIGAPGEAGGVVKTITGDFVGNTASGRWQSTDSEPLTPELVTELLKGNLYLNVHTNANQPGEVRGQIGSMGFGARLDTTQEVPAPMVASEGSGTGAFHLNPSMTELSFDITVCDLTGPITAAHFHQGELGVAGPVVKTISGDFDGNTASGVWSATDNEPLTPELLDELLAGNLYINVHTDANAPGEIRGQVNPDTLLVSSVERIDEGNQVPDGFSLSQNYPNPFNPTTEIQFSLTQSAPTTLKIYNLMGQEVAKVVDEEMSAGTYRVTFDAGNLPSGVYVYQLKSGEIQQQRRMVLLK